MTEVQTFEVHAVPFTVAMGILLLVAILFGSMTIRSFLDRDYDRAFIGCGLTAFSAIPFIILLIGALAA